MSKSPTALARNTDIAKLVCEAWSDLNDEDRKVLLKRARTNSAVSVDPGRPEKRIKTETVLTDEADTKTLASSEEQKIFTQVSVVSRPNDFNKSTWQMVDLEHSPPITQGATPLVARCMRFYHWSESEARKILKDYRQFLELKKIKGDWNAEILSPSAEVDLMWHQHILDVVNYSHDCMLLCGHLVGHNPDGGLNNTARAERRKATLAALKENFGEEAGDATLPTVVESRVANTDLITVRIRDIRDILGYETCFRIRVGQRLEILFKQYARMRGDNSHELRFLLDGETLLDHQTAEMVELEDNYQIDCMLEQGGC